MPNGLVRNGQPVVIPDGTVADQAVNKAQLDGQIATRATSIHTHDASAINAGQLANSRMPSVLSPTILSTGSGIISTDAALVGNNRNYTATGDVTIGVPTNPTGGQVIQYAVLASVANRTITFDAGLARLTGNQAGPIVIGVGKICRFSLRFTSLTSQWIVEAFGITQ